MQTINSLSVQELKQWQNENKDFTLLDVRQADEVAYARLSNSLHIPMHLIPIRHHEIDDSRPIVIYCHHGIRSHNVALFLAQAGFEDLYNLHGGIESTRVY